MNKYDYMFDMINYFQQISAFSLYLDFFVHQITLADRILANVLQDARTCGIVLHAKEIWAATAFITLCRGGFYPRQTFYNFVTVL